MVSVNEKKALEKGALEDTNLKKVDGGGEEWSYSYGTGKGGDPNSPSGGSGDKGGGSNNIHTP